MASPSIPPGGSDPCQKDVDRWFQRAVEAGCTPTMPPQNMFRGDRYAQLKDPFGVSWAINGPAK